MSARPWLSRLLRVGFLLGALALLLWAVAKQWDDVRSALRDLGVLPVVVSLVAVLVGLLFSALSWRALLADLGSRLPLPAALRVFFVGQLGKYVPGSVWPVLAQMELGRDYGADRRRVGATALMIMGVNVTTGLLVGAVLLPFTSRDALARYAWVLLVLPVGLVLLHPRVLTPLVNRGMRLMRREPLDRPLSARGVGVCVGWALAMWAAYGVQIWVLAAALDAHGGLVPVVSTGGFAVAWTVGFLFVIAPAGVGPREVVLVLALAPVLAHAPATAVALVSRLVMTLGDLVWGGLGMLSRSRREAQRPPLPDTSETALHKPV